MHAVVAGELDLGIAALPIDEPRLLVTPLFTEELLVALPAKHPLAARRKKLTPADLADQSFVLLDETHCLGEQVVSFCRDRKFQPTVTCRTAQLLTVQTMVALGQGLSLVPKMATEGPHQRRDIVYKSLGEAAPKRTLCLYATATKPGETGGRTSGDDCCLKTPLPPERGCPQGR